MRVGDAGDAVLAPSESTGPSVVVREVWEQKSMDMVERNGFECQHTAPGVSISAVVLSHCRHVSYMPHGRACRDSSGQRKRVVTCCPLAFGDVWTPFLPVLCALAILFEALLLLGEVLVAVKDHHGGGACKGGAREARCTEALETRGSELEVKETAQGSLAELPHKDPTRTGVLRAVLRRQLICER